MRRLAWIGFSQPAALRARTSMNGRDWQTWLHGQRLWFVYVPAPR